MSATEKANWRLVRRSQRTGRVLKVIKREMFFDHAQWALTNYKWALKPGTFLQIEEEA